MPSKVTETREPSKPRMRRLPPEVPYASLLVKLTPGIWFRLCMIDLTADLRFRDKPGSTATRVLVAVCSVTAPRS